MANAVETYGLHKRFAVSLLSYTGYSDSVQSEVLKCYWYCKRRCDIFTLKLESVIIMFVSVKRKFKKE